MNELWKRLSDALDAYDESDQRHRAALDDFIQLARSGVDLEAARRAERFTSYTRADREVAAVLAIESARKILSSLLVGDGDKSAQPEPEAELR
jgi:hypothetical protein